MRIGWAILAGLVLGGGIGWWLGRNPPASPRHDNRGTQADRSPALYRWRDDADLLHITQHPPKARHYERIPLQGSGDNRVEPTR